MIFLSFGHLSDINLSFATAKAGYPSINFELPGKNFLHSFAKATELQE